MKIKLDGLTDSESQYANAVADVIESNGAITQQDRVTLRNRASELGVSTVRAFSIEKLTKDEVLRIMAEQKAEAERKAEEARLRKEREEDRRREEQEACIAEEKRIEKERKEEEKRKAAELHQKELREERERQERIEKKRKDDLRRAKEESHKAAEDAKNAKKAKEEREDFRGSIPFILFFSAGGAVVCGLLWYWLGRYGFALVGLTIATFNLLFAKWMYTLPNRLKGDAKEFAQLGRIVFMMPLPIGVMGFIWHIVDKVWNWICG